MPAENEKFRAARERTASLAHPEECLTRQELAEMANAWIWKNRQKMAALSANYIGQIERGRIHWPSMLYREAFRAIFCVSGDAALGFVNTRRAVVKLKNVDRRQYIKTTVGMSALAVLGSLEWSEQVAALLENSEPTPVPSRVGATDIEQVRTAKQVFQSWGLTYGGGLAREAVMGQLRSSAGLLSATCPDRLRPELFSAVGDLADTAAYMALDAGADEEARRVFAFALVCAEEAKNWHLRAEVLSDMAVLAIRTGQPDEGLTLTEQALVRADRLTATEQAMLHTDRGRALAKMHRVNEARAAIGAADDHFAHSSPANDPPYMAYHNTAIHAGLTARALFDLAAVRGCDHGGARDRLTTAVNGHTAAHARPRTLDLTKLASLTMIIGDPIQAVAIGHEALNVAGMIRSRFAADDLRELAHYAAAHQNLDEVADLRHRIGTLLRRTDSR